ncbi:CPBP family intramembrane metalloprotease [Nostoc sp. 3335mG]|nr:CPBP family intramembrane metalloprotease [Nostoc sp. 3335mG]
MPSTHPGVAAGASLVLGGGVMAALLGLGPGLVERHVLPVLGPGASEASAEAPFVVAIFGVMVLLALLAGRVSGIATATPGLAPGRALAIGTASGLAGIAIAISYSAIAGLVHSGAGQASALPLLGGALVVLVQVMGEELYFRGWLQPVIARAWGAPAAIGIVSVLFAALHLLGGALSAVSLVNLLLGGILFGLLAARTGGIVAPIATHFAWNATEQLVFGLDPNPGVGPFGSIFDLDLSGAARWGGSGEGLNASIGMTMALLVVLVPLLIAARGTAESARA